MLIQFNFRNFKSYRDEVSLDMTATSIKEHSYNTITNVKGGQYLKVAAIYGANASGKTGVTEAFDFMRHFVLTSFKRESEGKGIPLKRFAFDKLSANGRSEFEVFFIYKNNEYQYGFTIDDKKVYEEWLYKKDERYKEKYSTLFERDSKSIKCGDSLKDAKALVNLVEESTLFLSFISNAKIIEAKNVFEWFLNTPVMDFGNAIMELVSRVLPVEELKDEKYQHNFENFLKAIDIGIDGIRIEEIKDTLKDGKQAYKVYSRHKTVDGSGYVEIPFSEESSGTQKLFGIYSYLIECLKRGDTLFVDELDAKLHPLLLRYIVNMFHNPDINKNNAQLVYTTHDTCILKKETFRRDQVWFSEKNESGISNLYSLAEYKIDDDKKVRNDASYDKDYLAGRYGAVPLLKEFNLLEEL